MRHKIEAIAIFAASLMFLLFGICALASVSSYALLGIGFVIIGVGAGAGAIIHAFKGRRITAGIIGGNIRIGGYWNDVIIPFKDVRAVERGVDSVIVIHLGGRTVIDDLYFKNQAEINAFVDLLSRQAAEAK